MKNKKKKRVKRNRILTYLMSNDPARLRKRVVKPKKGKGRKDKPRQKDWSDEASYRLGVDIQKAA